MRSLTDQELEEIGGGIGPGGAVIGAATAAAGAYLAGGNAGQVVAAGLLGV